MKSATKILISSALALACVAPVSSFGTTYTYSLNTAFSGNPVVQPSDPYPWLTLKFEDAGTGEVLLTITSDLSSSGGRFDKIYFNSTVFPLSFALQSASTGPAPDVFVGSNQYKADGVGGDFDILLDYPKNNILLDSNDQLIYTITGIGLTASSFNVTANNPTTPPGALYAAAHLTNANSGESTWLGDNGGGGNPGGDPVVPEPGTLVLTGLGIASAALWGRRKKA